MLDKLTRRILRTRRRPVQMAAALCARRLARTLTRCSFGPPSTGTAAPPACCSRSTWISRGRPGPCRIVDCCALILSGQFRLRGALGRGLPEVHRVVLEAGYELFNTPTPIRNWSILAAALSRRGTISCPALGGMGRGTGRGDRALPGGGGAASWVRDAGIPVPHFGKAGTRDLYSILEDQRLVYSTSLLAPRSGRFGLPSGGGTSLEIPVIPAPGIVS